MAPLALLDNVSYTYPGRSAPALRNVTLQFGAAEVVLVLGEQSGHLGHACRRL